MLDIDKKKITEIVGDNYVSAAVLYRFGIKFFDYSEKTLVQVCRERGLEVSHVIRSLESISKSSNPDITLELFPVDLIIEYLKHTHFLFVKEQLPFIAILIDNLSSREPAYKSIETDLKLLFPLFVEDFIQHIYEEEDSLFHYIMSLFKATKGSYHPSKLFLEMEKNSIQAFASHHEAHDDEMAGIRCITDNYLMEKNTPLHVRVLYSELQAFEKALLTHAGVENNILFPKALSLEQEVKAILGEKSKWN